MVHWTALVDQRVITNPAAHRRAIEAMQAVAAKRQMMSERTKTKVILMHLGVGEGITARCGRRRQERSRRQNG